MIEILVGIIIAYLIIMVGVGIFAGVVTLVLELFSLLAKLVRLVAQGAVRAAGWLFEIEPHKPQAEKPVQLSNNTWRFRD